MCIRDSTDRIHSLVPGRNGQIEYQRQRDDVAGRARAAGWRGRYRYPVAGHSRPVRHGRGSYHLCAQRLPVERVRDRAGRVRCHGWPGHRYPWSRFPDPVQHPGLNEETLLSIAVSDALAVILRPDQQDYQGTGVTVEVARKLDVPRMFLVLNKVPAVFEPATVKERAEQAYACDVAAVLPHSDEMMALASAGIFSLRYPDHPVTAQLQRIADRLVG